MRLDYIWAFHSKPLENRLDIREGISADLRKTLWSRIVTDNRFCPKPSGIFCPESDGISVRQRLLFKFLADIFL